MSWMTSHERADFLLQWEKEKYWAAKDQSHLNICLQAKPIEHPRLFIQILFICILCLSLYLCEDSSSPVHLCLIIFRFLAFPLSFCANVMILDFTSEFIWTVLYLQNDFPCWLVEADMFARKYVTWSQFIRLGWESEASVAPSRLIESGHFRGAKPYRFGLLVWLTDFPV